MFLSDFEKAWVPLQKQFGKMSSMQTHSSSRPIPSKRVLNVALLDTLVTSMIDSSVSRLILPPHTRQATTHLLSDLKSTTAIMDVHFLIKHAKALKPHTLSGWAALLGVTSSSLAAITLLSSITLSISIAGLWASFALLALIGTFITTLFAIMSLLFMGTTIVAAGMASTLLCTWAVVSTTTTIIKSLIDDSSKSPEAVQQVKEEEDQAVKDIVAIETSQQQDNVKERSHVPTMSPTNAAESATTTTTTTTQQYVLPKIKTSTTMKRHVEVVAAARIDNPQPKTR